MTRTECPTCSERFSRLATHYQHRPSHRQSLSERQRDVLSFLVLVGAHVRADTAEPALRFYDADEALVDAVSGALDWLANEPRQHAAENSDVHRFSTVPHPDTPTSMGDVSVLTQRVARWLVLYCGEWVGSVFGSLHLDCRSLDATTQQILVLLRDANITEVCPPTSTWQGSLSKRGHWREDVIALPHAEAMRLFDYCGLDVTDVAWSSDRFLDAEGTSVAEDI